MSQPTLSTLPGDILRFIMKKASVSRNNFIPNSKGNFLIILVLKLVSRDLHTAVSQIQTDRSQYAASIDPIKNDGAATLAYIAGAVNSIGLIDWLSDLGIDILKRYGGIIPAEWACCGAAWGGCLDLLKLFHEREYPMDYEKVVKEAIRGGQVSIIQWLRKEKKYPILDPTYALWASFPDVAAYVGNLDVWKSLPEHEITSISGCFMVAKWGHVNIIEWILEQGALWDSDILVTAACHGHINVLKWAKEKGYPFADDFCYSVALMSKHDQKPKVLRWMLDNNCPWDDRVCKDNLVIKKYLSL